MKSYNIDLKIFLQFFYQLLKKKNFVLLIFLCAKLFFIVTGGQKNNLSCEFKLELTTTYHV